MTEQLDSNKLPRKFRKKKFKHEQLHNIISLRISDEEKLRLLAMASSTSKSISSIMREAFDLWTLRQRQQLCAE